MLGKREFSKKALFDWTKAEQFFAHSDVASCPNISRRMGPRGVENAFHGDFIRFGVR